MQNSNYITKIRTAASEAERITAIENFSSKRLADAVAAKRSKPFFLPIQFTKSAAANNEVVSDFTDQNIGFDLDITAGITDIVTRDANIQDVGGKDLWADKHVNIENLFGFGGNNANTTGRMGLYQYPTPYALQANNALEVLLKNTTGGAADIKGFVCFLGQRTYAGNAEEGTFSMDERERVQNHITNTRAPRPVLLRANVNFTAASAAGVALNVQTDEHNEPILITGAYANSVFRSTMKMSDSTGYQFSRARFPAWALFARKGWIHQQFNYFKPFFLPPHSRLIMEFFNGYDGANFDPVLDAATGVYPHVVFTGWTV